MTNVMLEIMKPEIRRMLVLSTAHVRPNSSCLFPKLSWPGVLTHECPPFGAMIWVPDEPALPENVEPEDGVEVPMEILKLQLFARRYDCDWIMLDADGPVVEVLEVFNW